MTPVRVAYVLTCTGPGRLVDMTYLSAASVRRVHPDAEVVLVTDAASRAALPSGHDLLAAVDRVAVLETGDYAPKVRSRELKSRVREAVGGEFVLLDSDTLTVRPLAGLPADGWDVAVVADWIDPPGQPLRLPTWRMGEYRRLGWEFPPRYFNSGVVFFRDTPAAHEVGREWHRRWLQQFAVGTEDDDQFGLTSAVYGVPGARLLELGTEYNAMVRIHAGYAVGARVWHFYAGALGFDGDQYTLLAHLLDEYRASGKVDWDAVDQCVELDHPWVPPYWPTRLWQTGNRWKAVRQVVRTRAERLARAVAGGAA